MSSQSWRPSASLAALQQRAAIMARVRGFFSSRHILEVETPLLARYSVTDPYMDALSADNPLAESTRYYLQTSPEYAMKRLLAAGAGSIYQISKAFRRGEKGSRHNPEFSMLEWYRPGFDYHQLMDEVAELVANILSLESSFQRLTYRQVFLQFLDIDPFAINLPCLQQAVHQRIDVQLQSDNPDDWLNLLMTEIIEPNLAAEGPLFIYNYPASQAALAKITVDENHFRVAQRFELYINGLELANGYFELTDGGEQHQRFQRDKEQRRSMGRDDVEEDVYLAAAMEQGLPGCSGVALGLDRLVMLALAATSIDEVLAFPSDRA